MSPKGKPKMVPCPDCAGRGAIVWGTDDVTCATCGGKGKVKASSVQK